MIVEYTRYKLEEARRDAFEKDYAQAAKSLQALKHCLAFELAQRTEDVGSYLLRLKWDSEEGHLKGLRTSPEFQCFFAHVKPYVRDIEEMRRYRITAAAGRR